MSDAQARLDALTAAIEEHLLPGCADEHGDSLGAYERVVMAGALLRDRAPLPAVPAAPAVPAEFREGPTPEQARAHEACGGWWLYRVSEHRTPKRQRLTVEHCVGRDMVVVAEGAVTAPDRRPGWGRCPCLPDGTPLPWPGEAPSAAPPWRLVTPEEPAPDQWCVVPTDGALAIVIGQTLRAMNACYPHRAHTHYLPIPPPPSAPAAPEGETHTTPADLDDLAVPDAEGVEMAGHRGWLRDGHTPAWQAQHSGEPATCRACGAMLIEQTATHCWPRCTTPTESGATPAQREDPTPTPTREDADE